MNNCIMSQSPCPAMHSPSCRDQQVSSLRSQALPLGNLQVALELPGGRDLSEQVAEFLHITELLHKTELQDAQPGSHPGLSSHILLPPLVAKYNQLPSLQWTNLVKSLSGGLQIALQTVLLDHCSNNLTNFIWAAISCPRYAGVGSVLPYQPLRSLLPIILSSPPLPSPWPPASAA